MGEAFRDIYTMSSLQQQRWWYLLPSSVSNNSNIISLYCRYQWMLQFTPRWTLENHPSDKAAAVWAKCRQRERSISKYLKYLQYLDRGSPVITFHWSRSSLSRCPEIIIAPTVATCLCLKWKNHFTANPSSRTINSWRLENLKNIVKNIYDGKNKDERFQCCTWSRDKPSSD